MKLAGAGLLARLPGPDLRWLDIDKRIHIS